MRPAHSILAYSLLLTGLALSLASPLAAQSKGRQIDRLPGGRGMGRSAAAGSGTASGTDTRLEEPRRTLGHPGGSSPSPFRRVSAMALPRYSGHCWSRPNAAFWQHRDIMAEIQWMSRQGFVPVVPVGDEVTELNGVSEFPAGWRAYGFVVPAGGHLHVRLHHPNEGWFRLAMVNRWGDLSAGMLQNMIPTGNPEVRYNNPGKEAQAVYVIVDDPGWMSSAAYPYSLVIQKDWEPGKTDTQGVKMVQGIWASNAGASAEFARPHVQAGFGLNGRW